MPKLAVWRESKLRGSSWAAHSMFSDSRSKMAWAAAAWALAGKTSQNNQSIHRKPGPDLDGWPWDLARIGRAQLVNPSGSRTFDGVVHHIA